MTTLKPLQIRRGFGFFSSNIEVLIMGSMNKTSRHIEIGVDMKVVKNIVALTCIAIFMAISAAKAQTTKDDLGKNEYQAKCANCHGPEGRGNGPYSDLLSMSTPNLSTLTKNNGVFSQWIFISKYFGGENQSPWIKRYADLGSIVQSRGRELAHGFSV